MTNILLGVVGGILFQTALSAQTQHPARCGVPQMHNAIIAKHPEYAQKLAERKASLQAVADFYKQYKGQAGNERTTAVSAVPVIFHIIVDSAQFNNLGGTVGIGKRCDSQIAVLNHDYNRQNADSILIPSSWKLLYGNSGISFGLAHRDPSGNCSPGYEIKIIAGSTLTDAGYDIYNDSMAFEKAAGTGLAAWDNTKYYNVWCVNFTGSSSDLLGITVNKSDVVGGFNASYEMGVVILYNVLGSTGPTNVPPANTGSWYTPFNLGRTLTHETGHFFEIWHPSGDDGTLCPWNGGSDDGLTDTPPQGDYTYNNPSYTISGGTIHDGCEFHSSVETQPIGIACLSFMDYTDDDGMHLFTTMEAAVMAGMATLPPGSGGITSGTGIIGESYGLTQNPSLLVACPNGVASTIETRSSLSVYPNPTTGEINISVDQTTEKLIDIVVLNMVGQQVKVVNGGKEYYSIDLSGMSKGIYFVKCNFASGSVIRKILLQ